MLSRTFLLVIALILAFVSDASSLGDGAVIRITNWNLEWFPNGSPKRIPAEEQAKRIAAAADVLRPLKSDILLLQEVQDYDACARLAEAIRPHTYQVAICSAFKGGEQQVAILVKEPAQAAWAEPWKSMEGVDPPRGFAFAWFKIGNGNIGVYSLHLKSNLIMRGNKEAEITKYKAFYPSRFTSALLSRIWKQPNRSRRTRERVPRETAFRTVPQPVLFCH
jgi:Endonuclease/Exonuclease/phosphatase family